MFVMGDQNKMFGSLYDESDDRDAPIGSFKTLTNFIHSKTRSALQSRGGLVKDTSVPSTITLPSAGTEDYASKGSSATIHRMLPGIKFRLKSYPGVDFTLFPIIIKYDGNTKSGSVTNFFYALRFFINPGMYAVFSDNATGPSALDYNSWWDATPFFIDMYAPTANQITAVGGGASYSYKVTLDTAFKTTPPYIGDFNNNYHILARDLSTAPSGAIYVEASFTSPFAHKAEGLAFAQGNPGAGVQDVMYDATDGILYFSTLFTGVTNWTTVTTDVKLIRRLTSNGSLDHSCFLMDSSEIPNIDYDFLTNGNLAISVQSKYLNTIFEFSYIDSKYFYDINKGLNKEGSLFSRIDNHDSTNKNIYDRRLVVGYDPYLVAKRISTGGLNDIYTNAVSGAVTKQFNTSSSNTIDQQIGKLTFDSWSGGVPADNAYANLHYKCVKSRTGQTYFGLHMGLLSGYERTRAFYFPDSTYPLVSSYINVLQYPYSSYVGYGETTGNGIAKPSDEAVFTYGKFIAVCCGIYSGFRYIMHKDDELSITTPATYVLGIPLCIPTTFGKNMTGFSIVLSDDKSSHSLFNSTDCVNWKTIVNKDILDNDIQWDQILCWQDASWNILKKLPAWVVNFTIGANYYSLVDKGGNHLLQTGNPDYSRNSLSTQTRDDVVLGSYLASNVLGGADMMNEYEIGGSDIAVMRRRLFAANPRLSYIQNGNLKNQLLTNKYKERDNAIFYSGITESGPNFHLFDFGSNTLQLSETSEIIAISKIGLPQGLQQAVETERNNLLVLFRSGYQYWNLADNDPANWTDVKYTDDTCVSKSSVCESNGFVFCVGNTGVYMFLGTQKVDLTKLGGAKITKTWSAISTANKETTIGVFYPTEKWYIAIIPSLSKAYVFHLAGIFDQSNDQDKVGISEFQFAPHIGPKIVSACLHEGYIYVFCNDSTIPVLKYDPLSFGDYINSTITSGAIVKTAQPNYIQPDVRRTALKNLQIDYTTSDPITADLYADDTVVNSVSLLSGTKLTNVNPKYARSSRGLRYTVKLTVSGARQTFINLLDFNVEKAIQKRKTRRDV